MTQALHILVLGGTGWLGGEVARAALAQGHRVSCTSRGKTGGAPEGAQLIQLDRDAESGLDALGNQAWDAAIDVSSQPGQVRRAAQHLASTCPHFVYVSSASAYAENATPGADETAALTPALERESWTNMADYGGAKVACEAHVRAAFGETRCTLARVGLIGGPGDHTYRSGYWPHRFAKSAPEHNPVLVPDVPNLNVQIIDVRDLALWLLHCATARAAGTMNAVGVSTRFTDVIAAAQAVANHKGDTLAVSEAWLSAQGVSPWSGPKSLPLWVPGVTHQGFGGRSSAKAEAAGLKRRSLIDTFRDTLAWERSRLEPPNRKSGLSDADEAELIALFLQSGNA
jgi:2'-hydroxyisoflavone reductase